MITFKVVIVCVAVLLLPQLAIEAMPPAKRPAGRLKSKPAAAVRATHVKPRAGGKSSGVVRLSSAAQSRAMKFLMKALGSQRASGSGKVGKAGKAKRDLIAEPSVLRGAEEDDEDEDDFTPDRTVDPGPPPKSSKPLFFDALARGAAKHYSRMSSKVQPGTALHSIHYQRDGSVDVECLYYVHATKVQEEGLLVEATFLGPSGKAHSDLQNIRQGSDHLLHLCSSGGGCRSLRSRKGVIHVLQWASINRAEMSSDWVIG
jgi:hypothetical protein